MTYFYNFVFVLDWFKILIESNSVFTDKFQFCLANLLRQSFLLIRLCLQKCKKCLFDFAFYLFDLVYENLYILVIRIE